MNKKFEFMWENVGKKNDQHTLSLMVRHVSKFKGKKWGN
jgi:hypothetical protein